jgi:hypothetical protein
MTSHKSPLTELARSLSLSPTLQINELVQERLKHGGTIVHLGFGEATFPLQKDVLAAHREASNVTNYLPVAGLMKLREVTRLVCVKVKQNSLSLSPLPGFNPDDLELPSHQIRSL